MARLLVTPAPPCGLVGLTPWDTWPIANGKPRCEPSVIPLGAPLTSDLLLIYPSVLAMAGCYVARRVRVSSLRVVAGVDSRRSLRAAAAIWNLTKYFVVAGVDSRRSLRADDGSGIQTMHAVVAGG